MESKKINIFDTIRKLEKLNPEIPEINDNLEHDKALAAGLVDKSEALLQFLNEKRYEHATDVIIAMHEDLNSIEKEIRSGEADGKIEPKE